MDTLTWFRNRWTKGNSVQQQVREPTPQPPISLPPITSHFSADFWALPLEVRRLIWRELLHEGERRSFRCTVIRPTQDAEFESESSICIRVTNAPVADLIQNREIAFEYLEEASMCMRLAICVDQISVQELGDAVSLADAIKMEQSFLDSIQHVELNQYCRIQGNTDLDLPAGLELSKW